MLGWRVAPQSEVIRAIFWEDRPCCGAPHRGGAVEERGGREDEDGSNALVRVCGTAAQMCD